MGEREFLCSVEVQTLSTIKMVGHFYTELGNTSVFLGVFHYSSIWRAEITSPTGFSLGADERLVQLLVNFFSV